MNYINTATLTQHSESEIRASNPNTSFPSPFVEPDGFAFVFPTPAPDHNSITQTVREVTPLQTSKGHYEQQWEVVELFADQSERDAAVSAHLAGLKFSKNTEINAARLVANFSTFTHAGKQFACDQLSRSDIDGTNGFVSLYGVLPPGWPGGWKAVDNTYTAIATVDAWKSFYSSMFAAGSANFLRAQALKSQLDSATTAEQVSAIAW